MSSQLSWSQHGDALGIAVLAHRAAAGGHAIHLTSDGYAGPDSLAEAAHRAGLPEGAVRNDGDAGGPGVQPNGDAVRRDDARHRNGETAAQPAPGITLPRIVLYCGAAIGYPYYAYYSHCLWSLGLPYRRGTAADIAGGMLDDADVLILPGGFATWGLDRVENQPGVDDAIRSFLARGGAGIGSCGGAYYFSQGRPHWLGILDAKPRYTHEYLLTGAGLLNVRLQDASLRRDLPETMELAYYHGPVYESAERCARTGGTFESHIMSTQLFIDNPLDGDRFDRVMRDRIAILSSDAPHGRVVGFSPHPEMGEFLRKAMTLDGYVRHYLPIRGRKTMDETLRFYAKEDCLSFRLVLNAALMLGAFDGKERHAPAAALAGAAGLDLRRAGQAWHAGASEVAGLIDEEKSGLESLMGDMLRGLAQEWDALLASVASNGWSDGALAAELGLVMDDAMAKLRFPAKPPWETPREESRRLVEMLVLLELPVRLLAAAARIERFDRVVKESM